MLLLEEILVKKIIPGIRIYITKNHDPKVMNWSELARRLGVTPSAIIKYFNADLSKYIPEDIYPLIKSDLKLIRATIYRPGLTPKLLNKLILDTWIKWVSKGIVCKLIKALDQTSYQDCLEIMELYGEILIDRAIIEVDMAFKVFKDIPFIAKYIPEVSTNIVRLVEIGEDPWKYPVIGFPGRIVVVDNEIKVFDRPKLGGSRHMGTILRKLHILDDRICGLTGVGYDDKIKEAARAIDLDIIELNALTDNELIELIKEPRDIIIDRGGYGRVGFVYVTGYDSLDAVNKLKRLIGYTGG